MTAITTTSSPKISERRNAATAPTSANSSKEQPCDFLEMLDSSLFAESSISVDSKTSSKDSSNFSDEDADDAESESQLLSSFNATTLLMPLQTASASSVVELQNGSLVPQSINNLSSLSQTVLSISKEPSGPSSALLSTTEGLELGPALELAADGLNLQAPLQQAIQSQTQQLAVGPSNLNLKGQAPEGESIDAAFDFSVLESGETPSAANTEAAERDSAFVTSSLAEAMRTEQRNPFSLDSVRSLLAKQADGLTQNDGARGSNPDANADMATAQVQPLRLDQSSSLDGMKQVNNASQADSIITQIIDPIISTFEGLARRESRTLRIRLRPEELGQIDIELSRDVKGRLSAQITAEHEAARQTLTNSLAQLREALEKAGLTIEHLQVNVGTNSHESSAKQFFGESNAHQSRSHSNNSSFSEEKSRAGMRPVIQEEKLVSLRA